MTAIGTLPVLFATGDHASRPAAGDVGSGGLYSCTTHSVIYQTDGSTWTTWATLSAGLDLDATIAASAGQDIADALAGAAAPDAGNVFATMADVGGGGALVLLEQHTASSSATLDFTSFISSTYDDYEIRVSQIISATNNVSLLMRVGTGGGPTYDTGSNYGWHRLYADTGSTGIAGSGSDTSMTVMAFVSNDGPTEAVIRFSAPASATPRVLHWLGSQGGSAGYFRNTGGGWYAPTTAITALRFLMSSGNIASGIIRVYGVAK